MLPRHRRQFGTIGDERQTRPRLVLRLILGVIIIAIVWFLISTLFSLFDGSAGRKTPAILTVKSGNAVQVSLQDGEWQNSESDLKLYAGDSIQTRGDGDATITLFDGTRIRLDRNTEIRINKSEKLPTANSSLDLTMKMGRIWVTSPSSMSFSGAIARTIVTSSYTADIPAGTNALISSSLLQVAKSEGLGVRISLSIPEKKNPEITIGEGQYFSFNEDAKVKITEGRNPYDFRDPVTQDLLRDEFFVSSYVETTSTSIGASSANAPSVDDATPIKILSPEENAKITTKSVVISGVVNDQVSSLFANGSAITIKNDKTFNAELSLPKDKTFTIKIEAQDKQGIIIGRIERTVQNAYQVDVAPVRIKSPVGSGETLRTSAQEVEITGEAPSNTAGIIVNDYKLQLFKPGSKTWSYLASTKNGNFKLGTNVFTIYAVDADGNKSPSRSITIELGAESSVSGTDTVSSAPPIKQNAPLTPGVIAVNSPSTGLSAETSDDELSITGTTSPETSSVSVNGYALSLYTPGSTNWKYIASVNLGTMKRGKNVYRIVARNQSGEILDVIEYTLTFRP